MKRIILGAVIACAVTLSILSPAQGTDYKLSRATAPQRILGPTSTVDSLYVTFRNPSWRDKKGNRHMGQLHGLMSRKWVDIYDQTSTGRLINHHVLLTPGRRGTSDNCGLHPVGSIQVDPKNPNHLWTLYHGEQAAPIDRPNCHHPDHHTRWRIFYMQSRDGGHTWTKGKRVITQDSGLVNRDGHWYYACDDTGSPRLVRKGDYVYVLYRACNRLSSEHRRMSIARSKVSQLGRPGTWHKYYNGAWKQGGIGGRQSGIAHLPENARGISWNTTLNEYINVSVNTAGATLYASHDLLHWTFVKTLYTTGTGVGVWHAPCVPGTQSERTQTKVYGYGAIIGTDGSSAHSGRSFWIYYMYKPAHKCFTDRYLERRLVTIGR